MRMVESRSWSLKKCNQWILKLAASTLAVIFAFRIFTNFFDDLSTEVPLSDLRMSAIPQIQPDSVVSRQTTSGSHVNGKGKCDIFTGEWIPNPLGPAYTNDTCHVIEDHQNCMMNGRPDTGYLYWRWNPRNCELPLINAERFLEMMRNKSWALIGDSISRNHVQSMLCILSKVENPVEVYHDDEYKSRTWSFRSYGLTISVIWSPFLVEAAIFEDVNGVSSTETELYLDKFDKKWLDQYKNLDYIIFSTGKWFLKTAVYYEKDKIVGCHYCPKRNLTELGFDFAYRKSLSAVLNFIASSGHRGMIFFRTSTPDHFEGGEWFDGGGCERKSPVKAGEMKLKDLHKILRRIELEEFNKAVKLAYVNGVNLKLLDVNPLSLLRPDGHPGPYRWPHPFSKGKKLDKPNDCLHWCLPGPIDSWNDVIMQMVVDG
ncbi:trichome birefringence-like 23-like protein [Drosera capensis]